MARYPGPGPLRERSPGRQLPRHIGRAATVVLHALGRVLGIPIGHHASMPIHGTFHRFSSHARAPHAQAPHAPGGLFDVRGWAARAPMASRFQALIMAMAIDRSASSFSETGFGLCVDPVGRVRLRDIGQALGQTRQLARVANTSRTLPGIRAGAASPAARLPLPKLAAWSKSKTIQEVRLERSC